MLTILASFEVTFVLTRLVTHLQLLGILPNQSGPLHIHHLVPGVILLIISGFVGLVYQHYRFWYPASLIGFGIGAALTLDEFALLLHLEDVYWAREGRLSIDVVVIFTVLLLILILVQQGEKRFFGKKRS